MKESNNNSLSRQKSLNSDFMNLKEDFDQFRTTLNSKIFNSLNETFTIKNSPKTFTNFPKKIYLKTKHNNYLINKNVDKDKNYNINFNIEENVPKTPNITYNIKRIKKVNDLKEQKFKKALDSIKKLTKSKTQINFFSPDNSFKNIKDIQNLFSGFKNISDISKTSYNKKISKKKCNNKNYFNSSKSNTIYFNSSLDNFYIKDKQNRFKTISPLSNLNRSKYSLLSPQSYSVNFIRNIMNLYKKTNEKIKNESKEDIENIKKENKKKNDLEDKEKKEKNILNNIGLDTFNHLSLKTLFQKNSPKIKNGVLNEAFIDNKIKNNDIFLNPFSNSYGILLDLMSEKVGFMKGSMDIIYPKITQKKYQIRTLESKKIKLNFKKTSSQENIKNQNNELNHLFNIKQKKIIQSFYTKYPINIKGISKNMLSSKMYSFKGKKGLMTKKINKTSNI